MKDKYPDKDKQHDKDCICHDCIINNFDPDKIGINDGGYLWVG